MIAASPPPARCRTCGAIKVVGPDGKARCRRCPRRRAGIAKLNAAKATCALGHRLVTRGLQRRCIECPRTQQQARRAATRRAAPGTMGDPLALGLSPWMDGPVDPMVMAWRRREAAATIQLRRAWVAAAKVPALRLWRLWAGLWLDHAWRVRRPARLALRQAERASLSGGWPLAIHQAVVATRAVLAVSEAPRDRPR